MRWPRPAGSIKALRDIKVPVPGDRDFKPAADLMEKLVEPGTPWPGQLRLVREWYQPHLERIFEHFHTRIGDLDQLEQLSQQFPSRERFLTELTLDPPNATSDLSGKAHQDEDYLVLSTIHSAKGMEWDTVFVLNVVDGSFPNEFATGKQEMIDEERRLLYVAMTRARNELQLISPAEVPADAAVTARRCACLRRPQPLRHRQGAEVFRADRLHRLARQRFAPVDGRMSRSASTRPASSRTCGSRLVARLDELHREAVALADGEVPGAIGLPCSQPRWQRPDTAADSPSYPADWR